MKEQSIKVSIVVPVYNVPEESLRKCIESTISQSLEEIEIILVDDGSTDISGEICDEYSKKDNRIQVVHKKNAGLSAARNTGYRIASGEWITFLDSDDWIDRKTCEVNYKIGDSENVDIVIFGTVQEFSHYKKLFTYHLKNRTKFFDDECKKLQCEILNFTGNIATAWGKLIKKSVLDNNYIEHNEDLRQGSEGIEFNIRLFEKIQSAYFTDEVFYHYIYNPNSISAKHDEKNHYYVIKCFEEIKKQIEKSSNYKNLNMLFHQRFAYVIIASAISGYFSPDNKQTINEKKVAYINYLNNNLVQEAIRKTDISLLDFQRKLIWRFIKYRCFFILNLLAIIRYKQKHGRGD